MYMATGDCNCGVGFECMAGCTLHWYEFMYVHYIVFLHFYLCRITTWPLKW